MNVDPSDAALPEGQSGLTRAEGLWFEDCGLIIQAETTLFRVSREILAIQSPVFRDMLSLPPPTDADMMDGCPFVRLPDTAEDVSSFLRAVFYYDFFEPFPARTTFVILAGILRMSHKYDVGPLRRRALIHLSSASPTRLDEWDDLDNHLPSWRFDLFLEDQEMLIAELARQLGADWILPTTFYRMCQGSHERNMITPSYLSAADKINLIQGLRFLETTGAANVLEFLWGPYDCSDSASCSASRLHMHREVQKRRDYDPKLSNTMSFELWLTVDWGNLLVCGDCFSAMKTAHENARKTLWAKLPKIFGLSEWNELEKMKAEALK